MKANAGNGERRGRRKQGHVRYTIRKSKTKADRDVYRVAGYRPDGTRVRLVFDTYAEAVAGRNQLDIEAENQIATHRTCETTLTNAQLRDAEWAFATLGEKPLRAAVSFYLEHYRPPTLDTDVAEAVRQFLEAKAKENLRPDAIANLRIRCGRLAADFPGRTVAQLTSEEITALIHTPRRSVAKALSPTTASNTRRALSSFFGFAQRQGWIAKNPMDAIGAIKVEREEPQALSVPEVRRLMEAAVAYKDGLMVPYFVLATFCGLRPTELSRIGYADIDLDAKTVTVGAKAAKLRARRVVEISDNAVEWLLPHFTRRTPIRGTNWRRDFDAVKLAAGFGSKLEEARLNKGEWDNKKRTWIKPTRPVKLKEWVEDGLRHTAITFHFAEHQHEGQTASWAGNSPSMVHQHYRGLATKKDAAEFWSIRPEPAESKILKLAVAGA